MINKKAFIKLNGEIGDKETPCIEYIDNGYDKKQQKQKKEINQILAKTINRKLKDKKI